MEGSADSFDADGNVGTGYSKFSGTHNEGGVDHVIEVLIDSDIQPL